MATSPEIETSEKGEPVPLDVAVMSSVIETSEKRNQFPFGIVATSPEMKTSEKGEPVPLDVAATSSGIEISEKGKQFLLLQIPQRLLTDDNTIDMELFNRPDDCVHTEIIVSSRDKKNEEDEKKGKNA